MFRYRTRSTCIVAALIGLSVSLATLPPGLAHGTSAGIPAVVDPALLHGLDASEQAALARNGFVVTAPVRVRDVSGYKGQGINGYGEWQNSDPHHQVYWQFYDLYQDNYVNGIPDFITSDALLHTFHVMYDQTLVALERTVFAGKLQRLSSGLMDVATFQYGATTDAGVKNAARLNLGYVAVAERLLDPNASTPALVARPVAQELALIAAHRGITRSPLFGYAVDYSQFVPRGHYTTSATLRRYFQAMTWFGGLTFRLNGPDGALRTQQALLLVRGLTLRPDLGALWAAIFDPITAWVGRSDDLTVRDYQAVMARTYGSTAPVGALADDARLARFIALANALPDPQITGDLVGSSTSAARTTKGLRLFGRRFVPDAAIMQALIWDRIGTAAQPRLWPMGLDVAAALGSERAAALVTGAQGQARYAHYSTQLASVRKTYSALPAAAWHQNLYWGWLDTLRAVWGAVPPAAPAFMKGTAWADKSLATGLGSWAELRHDTLLYVKQPLGLGGGGGTPPLSVAYVEPVPLVYARLLALTQQLKDTLRKEGVLDTGAQPYGPFAHNITTSFVPPLPQGEQGYHAALDGFSGLVAFVQRIAERELLGQSVLSSDMNALRQINGDLALLTNFFQDNGTPGMLPVDKQVAAIADVFTEPMSGQVLEVGVGDVLPIYAVVTINGRRWLTRGGVYSYYEFHQPMSDRLTDQAWRHLPRRPDLPAWTAGYTAY